MDKRYPRILFRKRLKDLRKEMEDIGQRTIQAHKNAVDVFLEYDEETAKKVVADSKEIDGMVFDLERKMYKHYCC